MTNVLLVIAAISVIVMAAVLISQRSKMKKALLDIEYQQKSISEKENLLLKEAKVNQDKFLIISHFCFKISVP